jgi:phage shock protein A
MGLFDRISRVVRANLNDVVSKAEDPEKILEQSIMDMGEDLVQLRQAVAQAIATQKRSEQQYKQAQSQANQWQQRAQLALQKGDENLAREALVRKKTHAETAAMIKAQLDPQSGQVEGLKRNLIQLESKISEAKTKKNMLKARLQSAKAQEKLQNTIGSLNTNSSMAAFDRMEEKVLNIEARSQAAGELAGADLESQFAKLEAGGDVDDELMAMKAQLAGGSVSQPQLGPSKSQSNDVVDAELEELRSQLKDL